METFSGREYLKIDVANNFGLDKALWKDRIAWFDSNEHQLLDLLPQAEEPALYYAGVKAWFDVKAGKPTGYMISLDATSSGLQLLAALTSCPYTALLCNVVNTGRREDAYTNIYQFMLTEIKEAAKIERHDVKDAVMTAFYSSRARPRLVFGEGQLLDTFYHTLIEKAPGAWELNEAMLALWDPTTYIHSWVLPDNFHVHVKVMKQIREEVVFLNKPFEVFYNENKPTKDGRSLGANTVHSLDGMIVRELTRRCDYDPKRIKALRKLMTEGNFPLRPNQTENTQMVQTLWRHFEESGYLSARILDYLDEDNLGLVNLGTIWTLLDSLPAKPFTIVSIHDCFRVLPNYANDLRKQYNLQLQLIAKSNILQWLLEQLTGRPVPISKLDPNLWMKIGETNYALS